MYKKIAVLISLIIFSLNTYAGTCSSLSRTNYSANSILTSTALNTDFNQILTQVNDFDGGCVTDGTLEFAAINTSEWAAVLNGIQRGCKVTYSNASTVLIDRCIATVNDNQIRTTTTTSLQMGCGDCSSETASTTYYVYIKNDSSGTTINPFFSTSAPNNDGYDGSSNAVVARLYNNSTSDIDQYSIDQWTVNRFIPTGTSQGTYSPTITGFGTVTSNSAYWHREGKFLYINGSFTSGTISASKASISLPSDLEIDADYLTKDNNSSSSANQVGRYTSNEGNSNRRGVILTAPATSLALVYMSQVDTNAVQSLVPGNGNQITANTTDMAYEIKIPIKGWSN